MIFPVVISIKKKAVGILICILLFTSFLPVVNSSIQTNGEPLVDEFIHQNDKEVEKTLLGNSSFKLYFEKYQNKQIVSEIPDSFSWKDIDGKDYTTPSKNQNPVPCWASSAIAALESTIEIREDCPELNPDLSEQYIISCLPKIWEENNVRPFFWIMNISAEGNDCNGVITESCFPYEGLDVPCSWKSSDWQEHLIPISNFSYWIPDKSPYENDEIIKTKIMETGPVTATMEYNRLWEILFDFFHTPDVIFPNIPSIYSLLGHWGGLHIITLLGWQDNPLMPSGGYWICKNTWGTDWGYDGFFNTAYGSLGIGRVIYPIDDIYIPYIGTVEYDPDSYDWPPVAKSGGPYGGIVGENITFDASESVDAEEDIVYYHWDFGDGTNEMGIICTHQYLSIGEYEVTLTVTDGGDNRGSATTVALINNGGV